MDTDNNETVGLLTALGISRNDALTYAALSEMESVSIRKIADRTGINRGTTYESLKSLVSLGLASTHRRGQREYFSAESPEKIYDIIRDRRKDLLEVAEKAKQVVPKILAQKVTDDGKPLVRYYEGDEGVAAILRDVLQTCRALRTPAYYAYSSSRIRQYLYRNFPQFTDRRIAEGIHVRVIGVGEGGEVAAASERKWLRDNSKADTSSYTLIYADKVAVISISDDFTPYGVTIEDAGAAAMQRLLFEQLWNLL